MSDRIKHIFDSIDLMEGEEFTENEFNFIISVEEQFKEYGNLSDRQVEILEEIFRRAKSR